MENLNLDSLNAFFINPLGKDGSVHSDEILINLRNHAICENIFLILEANKNKKDFSLIIGNDHLEGLKVIFNSKESVCKEFNLTINYYPTDKEIKNEVNTKIDKRRSIQYIPKDSPILAKMPKSPSQQPKQLVYVSVDSISGPVCLPPKL